jgi:hypothetical protein
MGQVSLFLGIEFTWIHHTDGHVSVHLTQQYLQKLFLTLWVLNLLVCILFLYLTVWVFQLIQFYMNQCHLQIGMHYV